MRSQAVKKSKRKRTVLIGSLILALALVLPVLCNLQKVIKSNTYAFGLALRGLSKEEALEVIEENIRVINEEPLVFEAGALSYRLPPTDFFLVFDETYLEAKLEEEADWCSQFILWFTAAREKETLKGLYKTAGDDLEDLAERIARQLSSKPTADKYEFSGFDLVLLPGQKGQAVKAADVLAAFYDLQGGPIRLPWEEVEVPEEFVLEPLSVLGSFQRELNPAKADMLDNVILAAKAIHGKVLDPGEFYSFNEEAGERSVERGYTYGDVVVGNRIVKDVGGGICFPVTALFNAAAESGLEFVEIHTHGIPVDYVDPGCDAAVAWDYLDFKVKNPFERPVIFGIWISEAGLVAKVFGHPSGYEYELESVLIEEYPEEGMVPGMLVDTFHVQKKDGAVVSRKRLCRSYYRPSFPREPVSANDEE